MMTLTGTCTGEGLNGDTCCKLAGVRCKFVVENIAGRRFACALMLKYGSWSSVIRSKEYQPIGEFWESSGNPYHSCMTSDPAFCCRPDLRQGRHNQNCPPNCEAP